MIKPLFDQYAIVDWSAAGTPKTGADSICIGSVSGDGPVALYNPATRHAAMEHLRAMIDDATAAGLRLFVGFDFAFGYPVGTAKVLTGKSDWRAIWAKIADLIEDAPDNSNNRFDVAAKLNHEWPGEGPFWGNGLKRDIAGLPRRKPNGYGDTLPPNKRFADAKITSAQEVWKLSGIGSVGGQTLMGIAALQGLRSTSPVEIWPFETLGEGTAHVLAEVYPSIVPPHPDEAIRDAGQVRMLAEICRSLDQSGDLGAVLQAPMDHPDEIKREEASIFGMDHIPLLKNTAAHCLSATPQKFTYERSPAAIYEKSFATVRAEATLDHFSADMQEVATRLIHSCGMIDLPEDLAFSDDCVSSAQAALSAGSAVLCDCEMVVSGVIQRFLPAQNKVLCSLNQPGTIELAHRLNTTRSAAATEHWIDNLNGAVVVLGNAPTALFHLLEGLARGWPKPAAILGFPVGFVGAAESKAALAENTYNVPFLTLQGRRGGSAMASAALNALAIQAGKQE